MQKLEKFIRRLKAIGIEVELASNYPWLYLRKVNGIEVKERFWGRHGFTIMFLSDPKFAFTDRRRLFKKIREVLNSCEEINGYDDEFDMVVDDSDDD